MRATLIVIVLAALACCVGFVANTFDHRAVEWLRVHLAALGMAPLLPALALLALRRGHAAGIAYTTGGALVGALLLALPAGLLLLLIGLSSGPAQRNDSLLLAGYEFCLIGLLITGIVALVRQPSGERAWGVLLASVVLIGGYGGFVVWLTSAKQLVVPYDRQASVQRHDDAAARKTLATIAECARTYAHAHPKDGYPAALTAIESCVGKRFESRGGAGAGAAADGYLFFYFSDPPDDAGVSRRFAICARPIEPQIGGSLVLGVNPAGMTAERPVVSGEPASCFDVWAGNADESYLEALSACVMSLASPQRGYPQWFSAGGGAPDSGLACGVAVLDGRDMRLVTPRGIVEYLPDLPDAKGRARRYVMYLYPSSGGGGALSIDQTGAIRRGLFPGVEPTLEAIEAARPAEKLRAERIAVRRESLTRECRAGDLDGCDALGDFEWEHGEPIAAQAWWDNACERGRLMSCLFSSRYSPQLETYPAQSAKERCQGGEAHYCQQLETMLASQRAEIEAMRAKGGRPIARVRGDLAPPSGGPQ
jgi:hypothetical protein